MIQISRSVIAAALLAGVAAPAAAQTVITTETTTGSGGVVTTAPLALTPSQRTVIYRTIRRPGGSVVTERVVTERPVPADQIVVGSRVPGTVALSPLPDTVVTEVPAVSRYRYMTIDNRVWLVDPATSTVVAEIVE